MSRSLGDPGLSLNLLPRPPQLQAPVSFHPTIPKTQDRRL